VRTQGADLAVAGGANLSDGAVDARLIFTGVAGPTAPAGTRPEVVIALKGPIESPRRSIDVAALSSWLALRAVEQQSKKLDLLEGREPPPSDPPAADIPTGSAPPQSTPPQGTPATPSAAPGTVRIEPETPQPRPTFRVQPKPKPTTAEQVQPLPPPIDIRPAPTPRAPRVHQGTTGQQGATRQPPAPAAPRSLSEILFGR
jgi:hypothetical protein